MPEENDDINCDICLESDDGEEDDYPEPIKHSESAINIFDTIFGKR